MGRRPLVVEEIRFEYPADSGALASGCEVVLDETRPSFTASLYLDTGLGRLGRVLVIDHRGIAHHTSLRASKLSLLAYKSLPQRLAAQVSPRLAVATNLNSYYSHPNRDPFGLKRAQTEQVGESAG
jgi:hypothetical protein